MPPKTCITDVKRVRNSFPVLHARQIFFYQNNLRQNSKLYRNLNKLCSSGNYTCMYAHSRFNHGELPGETRCMIIGTVRTYINCNNHTHTGIRVIKVPNALLHLLLISAFSTQPKGASDRFLTSVAMPIAASSMMM